MTPPVTPPVTPPGGPPARPDGGPPAPRAWPGAAAVVLAGGASRRMGCDKLAQPLVGEPEGRTTGGTVLDVLLSGVPATVPVVLVGPPRPTSRPVATVREDPPGGGPAAAVAAGAACVAEGTRVVVVLAGDAPFAPRAVPLLLGALDADPRADAAVAVDPSGEPQPLLAAYRRSALAEVTAGDLAGRPARALLDTLAVVRVPVGQGTGMDVDTPADLVRARRAALRLAPS